MELAVAAHVRHVETGYDGLLGRGVERHDARSEVHAQVDRVLRAWRGVE